MSKKEYKQPSLKVIEIDSSDIICGSPDEPTTFSLFDGYVAPEPSGSASSDIWGTQW